MIGTHVDQTPETTNHFVVEDSSFISYNQAKQVATTLKMIKYIECNSNLYADVIQIFLTIGHQFVKKRKHSSNCIIS